MCPVYAGHFPGIPRTALKAERGKKDSSVTPTPTPTPRGRVGWGGVGKSARGTLAVICSMSGRSRLLLTAAP